MKVYVAKEDWTLWPCDHMIYDHKQGIAFWGEGWYYVDFNIIKQHWFLIGDY